MEKQGHLLTPEMPKRLEELPLQERFCEVAQAEVNAEDGQRRYGSREALTPLAALGFVP